jgi:hypothetical protein
MSASLLSSSLISSTGLGAAFVAADDSVARKTMR